MEAMRLILVFALAAVGGFTQPLYVRARSERLEIHVAPPARGTPEEPARAAIKYLTKAAHSGRIVKLRAFVVFPELGMVPNVVRALLPKNTPIVSVIRVAGFEDPSTSLLLEAWSEAQAPANYAGLAFVSGQATNAPLEDGTADHPVLPLAQKSLASLDAILAAQHLTGSDVLAVTCFTSSLVDSGHVRALLEVRFPNAQRTLLKVESRPGNQVVECESAARLRQKPVEPVVLVNPTGAAFAQAALIGAPVVIFTAAQFGDARQAFQKTAEVLAKAGSNPHAVIYAYAYPPDAKALVSYRDTRWEFLDRALAPASTNLPFEPRADGLTGIDVIALPAR